MPVTVYRSTDASAPVLTGTQGTLITVLDAVLVNGYGSKAAAGWTKPYSGTNLAAYRSGAGTQFYYRIDEAGASFIRDASVRGYETMSAISTGTGEFPTTTDMANGMMLRRSNTADTVARPWIIVADNKTCYMFFYDGAMTGYARGHMVGDYHSYLASPTHNAMIIGGEHTPNQTTAASIYSRLGHIGNTQTVNAMHNAYWLARDYTQIGTAKNAGLHTDTNKNGGSTYFGAGSSSIAYPNSIDGGIYLAPVWVHRSGVLYGELRGLWCPCHNQPFADGDTFAGSGELAGKTFMAINLNSIGNSYQLVVETSNTWKN